MSLENDIQQREFRNEYHKALLNIIYTNNHVVNSLSEIFKHYDLTRQQYNVLRILKGRLPNSASINLIKDRMLDKMSDTSRIVERLRIKGLIARKGNEKDKRAVEVTITEKGLALLDAMEPEVSQTDKVLGELTAEEASQLNALLDKIRSGEK
jgi:DNA-binding MarR family transcriptional regulator